MSIQAMAWAIEQQEIRQPELRLLLLCLANHADSVGRNAFPSIARLCRDTGFSESTVRRKLQQLIRLAMIVPGNRAVALAHVGRADKCPKSYDLTGFQIVTPRSGDGVSAEGSRGVKSTPTGCQSLTPNPKKSEETLKKVTREEKEEFKRSLRVQALASNLAQSKKLARN